MILASAPESDNLNVKHKLNPDEYLVDSPDNNQGQDVGVKAVDVGVEEVASEDGGEVETESRGEDQEAEAGDEVLGYQVGEAEGGDQDEHQRQGPGEHLLEHLNNLQWTLSGL